MPLTLKLQNEKLLESPFTIIKPEVSETEFWAFANEDIKCELLDGVLFIHSSADSEHEDVFSYLMTLFRLYLDHTQLGKVFSSRLVMRLSDKWSPEPDLMIISPKKDSNLQTGRLEGPADIVVEILSESTRESDLSKKVPHFLNEGVQEIWIIDPKNQCITQHFPDKKVEYSDPSSEEVIKSQVLPDFQIQVRWIWDRVHYKTSQVIQKILS